MSTSVNPPILRVKRHPTQTLLWLYHGLLRVSGDQYKRYPDTSRSNTVGYSQWRNTQSDHKSIRNPFVSRASFISHFTAAMWKDSSNGKKHFMIYNVCLLRRTIFVFLLDLVRICSNVLVFVNFLYDLTLDEIASRARWMDFTAPGRLRQVVSGSVPITENLFQIFPLSRANTLALIACTIRQLTNLGGLKKLILLQELANFRTRFGITSEKNSESRINR